MHKALTTIGNYEHLPADDRPWVGIGEMSDGQKLFCRLKSEESLRLHVHSLLRASTAKDWSQHCIEQLEELEGR